jgi:hypothetical protein
MAHIPHKTLVLADNHVVHAFSYANAAARTGAVGLLPADVGKMAIQVDEGSFWVLQDDAPVTWIRVGPLAESVGVVIDGGTSVPTAGSKGYRVVPYACTVTGWEILADASGSAVVDVKKGTYAGFPATATIAGTEKPTLTGAQKNQNLALTLWTTGLLAGDVLEFNLDSVTTCKRVTVTLFVTRV